MDFNYKKYSSIADTKIIQILMINDYTTIVNKLMLWENTGKDNPVWQIMPTLSCGANQEDRIFDDVPYAVGLGEKTSTIMNKILEDVPLDPKKGAKKINIKIENEETLSFLAITLQFSLLEYYEFECYRNELFNDKLKLIDTEKISLEDMKKRGYENLINGRIDYYTMVYSRQGVKKRIENWKNINIEQLDPKLRNTYEEMSVRRNELIHEVEFSKPNIDEAIAYYENCKILAKSIGNNFKDITV
jgi:hypothetical protein